MVFTTKQLIAKTMSDLKIIADANTALDIVQRGLGLSQPERYDLECFTKISNKIVNKQYELRRQLQDLLLQAQHEPEDNGPPHYQ